MVDRRAVALSAVTGVAFVLLTVLVATRWQPLMSLDRTVVDAVHDGVRRQEWLIAVMRFVDVAFAPYLIRIALLVAAGVLLWRGLPRTAVWLAIGTGLEVVLVVVLKQAVDRPRPELSDPLHDAAGASYPSGHSSGGALLAGVVIVLVFLLVRRGWVRVTAVVLAVGFAVLLGANRVILGVHHPSDVVGSYLLVTALLAGVAAAVGTGRHQARLAAAKKITGMRKSRMAVVLNPVRMPDPRAFRRMVNDAAQHAGWDTPMWFETSVDDAGHAMTHAALTAGADLVIAAGGDGTVRVVASELARTGVALGILPAGTGNLLARNLSLPLQLDTALEVALTGQDRAIDLVRMSGDGMEADHFAVMGGLGLDAAIMQGAPDGLKKRVGWPAYFIAGLRHFRDPAVKVEIAVDDGPAVKYRARTVVIGNVGTITGGIPLLPDAAPDDGLLDVVVVAPRRFLTWFRVLARVLTRRRLTDERLDRRTGRSVVVRAEHPTPRQMDGDGCGSGTEIRATIEPGVLLVRVPR